MKIGDSTEVRMQSSWTVLSLSELKDTFFSILQLLPATTLYYSFTYNIFT